MRPWRSTKLRTVRCGRESSVAGAAAKSVTSGGSGLRNAAPPGLVQPPREHAPPALAGTRVLDLERVGGFPPHARIAPRLGRRPQRLLAHAVATHAPHDELVAAVLGAEVGRGDALP